jgi:hypothetical protein
VHCTQEDPPASRTSPKPPPLTKNTRKSRIRRSQRRRREITRREFPKWKSEFVCESQDQEGIRDPLVRKKWNGADRSLKNCIDLTRLSNHIEKLWRSSAQKEAPWEKAKAELKALKRAGREVKVSEFIDARFAIWWASNRTISNRHDSLWHFMTSSLPFFFYTLLHLPSAPPVTTDGQ